MNLLNSAIVATMPLVPKPIVRKISARYIAGDNIADAVIAVRNLEKQGCCATMDILGEYIAKKEEAQGPVAGYLNALEAIYKENIDSNVSIKLTQFGLGLDTEYCYENVYRVVKRAKELEIFVRIDMEDSSYTTRTIEIFQRLKQEFDNIGIVIQAYLRRSRNDIRSMLAAVDGLNIRLCKGIYIEKRNIAFKDPAIVNDNFTSLLEEALQKKIYVGIATHDEKLVWNAMDIIDRMKLPRDAYEFQMLLGVDHELRKIITGAGHKLRVYVPFGEQWYGYSVRRLKKIPKSQATSLKISFPATVLKKNSLGRLQKLHSPFDYVVYTKTISAHYFISWTGGAKLVIDG